MSVICLSSVHILVSYQFSIFEKLPLLMEKQKKHQQLWLRVPKKFRTHGGTRTPNLRFRRPTPYPLGHAGILERWPRLYYAWLQKMASESSHWARSIFGPSTCTNYVKFKIGLYRVFTLPKFKKWVEIVATMSSMKNSLYRVYTRPKFKKWVKTVPTV